MDFLTTFVCIAIGVLIGNVITDHVIAVVESKMNKEKK